MQITAIMGTNRDGHTQENVRRIEAFFQEQEPIQFNWVFLKDKDIRTCTGCHNCIFSGEQFCPLKHDDVARIVAQMKSSDAVIFASPGYMMNVTGIMKQFLDRVAYNCHRPSFFSQKALLVSNSSPWSTKAAVQAMQSFVEASGFDIVEDLQTAYFPIQMTAIATAKEDRKVQDSAARFYQSIKQQTPRKPIGMGGLMQFASMQYISSLAPQLFKADNDFFNALRNKGMKHWYIPVRIKPFPFFMSKLMMPMIKSSIRKTFVPERDT